MSTSQDMVKYVLTRDIEAQRIHFEATFPERADAWTLQLPTWRPGRYELGNFAQYVLWVESVGEDGQRTRLKKRDLHAWSVPGGIRQVEWLFHADILNAGSTCIESDLFYVNPVNCFMFDLERQDLGAEVVLGDLELNPEVEGGWSLAVAMPWHLENGVPSMHARGRVRALRRRRGVRGGVRGGSGTGAARGGAAVAGGRGGRRDDAVVAPFGPREPQRGARGV